MLGRFTWCCRTGRRSGGSFVAARRAIERPVAELEEAVAEDKGIAAAIHRGTPERSRKVVVESAEAVCRSGQDFGGELNHGRRRVSGRSVIRPESPRLHVTQEQGSPFRGRLRRIAGWPGRCRAHHSVGNALTFDCSWHVSGPAARGGA